MTFFCNLKGRDYALT